MNDFFILAKISLYFIVYYYSKQELKTRKELFKILLFDKIIGKNIVYYSMRDLANDLQIKENVLRNVFNSTASMLNEKYLFIKENNNEN